MSEPQPQPTSGGRIQGTTDPGAVLEVIVCLDRYVGLSRFLLWSVALALVDGCHLRGCFVSGAAPAGRTIRLGSHGPVAYRAGGHGIAYVR